MNKNVKASKKLVDKEIAKLSKARRKELDALGRGGNGESMRPTVFADKRRRKENARPNVNHMYRKGAYD